MSSYAAYGKERFSAIVQSPTLVLFNVSYTHSASVLLLKVFTVNKADTEKVDAGKSIWQSIHHV